MDRYVVIGNPVAHSLSPVIHARFARQLGDEIAYDRLLVEPGEFAGAVEAFFAGGGQGANVTLPFKGEAFTLARKHTARARRAQAVNTLAVSGGSILGDNTDGVGLVRDLTANLGVELAGARILLLGAGGAARGVMAPILACSPAIVVVANRTASRARELALQFRDEGNVQGVGLETPGVDFDLVINATSTSTLGEALNMPDRLFSPGVMAYDLAYGRAAEAFLERARRAGARASDGLGMLVEQAAESFALWRGRRPETSGVIAALRGA